MGTLDRSRKAGKEAAEMWQRTLDQVPTTFGRLVYLSSLRDPNSARYEHHGLAQIFGEAEAEQTLRESHQATFAEWLSMGLQEQKNDLERYLSSFQQVDKRTVLRTWSLLTPYRNLIPAEAGEPERQLYLSDLETILELLRNEHDVALTDPDE